jgi:DNA mismatch endonuclease (patch repair protein)
MDFLNKSQRHTVMSHIRSKDTRIELKLRRVLWHAGYRYRKNYHLLPGTPDIVLTKYKIAIFCDGEFFHGKDWHRDLRQKIHQSENHQFWEEKIDKNIQHDMNVNHKLEGLGWTVLRFWGMDIKRHPEKCLSVIQAAIDEKMDKFIL